MGVMEFSGMAHEVDSSLNDYDMSQDNLDI